MANLINNVNQGNQSQLDLLVDAYKRTQQPKVNDLETRKTQLEARRNFFNGLNSRLNSLINSLDKFTLSNSIDNFKKKTVTSSDSSVITATASTDADLTSYNVKVNQLASKDVLLSNQQTLANNFGLAANTYSFDITIGSNTKTVNVTLDGSETFETGMKKIVNAINNTTDIGVKAAFVKDSTTTGRISITSNESGANNRIQFTDSAILSNIGIDTTTLQPNTTNRTVSTTTNAGFTKADYNQLNSKLIVNNIEITRSTNTIDDAIDGITFNLLKAQSVNDNEVLLTTEVDTNAVKSFIEPLLKDINELMNFISSNANQRRGDSAINTLWNQLRGIPSGNLNPNGGNNELKFLSDIGIKIDRNSNLSINDINKLKDKLIQSPNEIYNLFAGADGLVIKLNNAIEPFKGESNLIRSRTNSLNNLIDQNIKKTNEIKNRIDIQAESLRKQYLGYMKALNAAQSQYNLLGTFSVDRSGYNSLLI